MLLSNLSNFIYLPSSKFRGKLFFNWLITKWISFLSVNIQKLLMPTAKIKQKGVFLKISLLCLWGLFRRNMSICPAVVLYVKPSPLYNTQSLIKSETVSFLVKLWSSIFRYTSLSLIFSFWDSVGCPDFVKFSFTFSGLLLLIFF